MKKILTILSLGMLMLASCSKDNTAAVQQFAEKFQGYAAQNNLDSIKTVWAECTLDSVAMPEGATVTLGEPNDKGEIRISYTPEVWVDVTVNDQGLVNVLSTHGIAAFPADKYEIAKGAGMIDPALNDSEIAKRMADGEFFSWLSAKAAEGYDNAVTLTEGKKSITFSHICEGRVVRFPITITNNTSMTLSPDDYVVSYDLEYATCSDGSSPNGHRQLTKKGTEIAPGQSIDMTLSDDCCENINRPTVKLKMSAEDFAAQNSKLTGNEYAEYLKSKK